MLINVLELNVKLVSKRDNKFGLRNKCPLLNMYVEINKITFELEIKPFMF